MIRHDFGTFLFYLILRFLAGIAVGLAVLFVLFPVLMGLSSVAIVIAAMVLLGLHAVGLTWIWNPLTFIIGAFALGLFSSVLFGLLSVVGMPGQVYLQDYGLRFMASRIPKLSELCRAGIAFTEAQ